MSGLALAIVLVAAVLHAGWNFLAKKSRNKMAFIWWFLLIASIGYLPMFIFFWPRFTSTPAGWACIVATGLLHALYFWFMGGAYERGDLSLVYPLSRGSGPLLVPILAVTFLQEQLSPAGVIGIILVVIGIYAIHLNSFTTDSFFEPLRAMRYIHYTVWCAHQVAEDVLSRIAPDFGSHAYWQKEINDLAEQLERIRSCPPQVGNFF